MLRGRLHLPGDALRWGVLACIALLLAMFTPGTIYPFVVRRRDDGRHELRWRPSEGAGYHQLTEARDGGRWRRILYAYDPDRNSFVAPGPRGPGTWRYRISACRYPGQCSAVTESPPLTVRDGEAGRVRRDDPGAKGGPKS